MRDEHIINILESAPLASLSESELAAIRAHTSVCAECLGAYEAAHISALLLRERAAETIEPSPFFQTRVLAAVREQTANGKSALGRLWRSSGALVSTMAATVAALAILTFFVPGTQPAASTQDLVSNLNASSAEEVIFDEGTQSDEQLSYGQVLTTLYEFEEESIR
jgi:anti-sigma-K factor RskA